MTSNKDRGLVRVTEDSGEIVLGIRGRGGVGGSGTGLGELFQKLNICERPSYKNISLVRAKEGSGDDGAAGLVGAGELLQVQPSSAVLSLGTTQ